MTMRQVLDGIESVRTLVNHPNLSSDEKITALKTLVESVRNDIQDLAETVYDNYVDVGEDDQNSVAIQKQVDTLYESLKKQEFTDLVFFYKRSVFENQIDHSVARYGLAKALLRIAADLDKTPPKIWVDISNCAGNIDSAEETED